MNATKNLAAQVDRAALHARDAQLAAARVQAMAKCDVDRATQFAREAGEEARRVLVLLCESLGAAPSSMQPGGEASEERSGFDLSTLASLDTPPARELLALLEQTQAVAERVDAARGNVLPPHIALQPGESRGTGHAESICEIAVVLRGEIFGCEETAGRD